MPTAILTLTENGTVSGSGLIGRANLYANDDSYFQCTWSAGTGDRWAGYNTNASSIIPAGAILQYWRIKYRVYSPNWTTTGYPLPKVWFAQYLTGVGIGDYDITATETQFTWPNPTNFPNGSSLDGVVLSELTSLKFGGSSTSTASNLYFDELIVEVDYLDPPANNTLFLGENF